MSAYAVFSIVCPAVEPSVAVLVRSVVFSGWFAACGPQSCGPVGPLCGLICGPQWAAEQGTVGKLGHVYFGRFRPLFLSFDV